MFFRTLTNMYVFSAILEWTIAFGYTLYLLTFAYDLRLSKGVAKHQLNVSDAVSDRYEMSYRV